MELLQTEIVLLPVNYNQTAFTNMENTDIEEIENNKEDIWQTLDTLQLKDYTITEKYGQKTIGPPLGLTGPPPERGSELYVSNLHKNCNEEFIFGIFKTVAPIYMIRIMLDFDGTNRGYAFISYFNAFHAWKGVTRLNNYEIKGRKISVVKSFDNRMLYIGGIPKEKTKADAWIEVHKVCPTVKDIIMYFNPKNSKKNRGFLFVEFDSHRSAAVARRRMIEECVTLWGFPVYINWAQQELDVDLKTMFTTTKLFIKNLNEKYNKERIYHLLTTMVPSTAIMHICVSRQFGFVHFDNRKHAEIAKEGLSLCCLDGEMLEVHWARPYRRSPFRKDKTPLGNSTYNLSITRPQDSETISTCSSVDSRELMPEIMESTTDESDEASSDMFPVMETDNHQNRMSPNFENQSYQFQCSSDNTPYVSFPNFGNENYQQITLQNNIIDDEIQNRNFSNELIRQNEQFQSLMIPNHQGPNYDLLLMPRNEIEQFVFSHNNLWQNNQFQRPNISFPNPEDQYFQEVLITNNGMNQIQNNGIHILNEQHELYQDYSHQFIPLPAEGYQNMQLTQPIPLQIDNSNFHINHFVGQPYIPISPMQVDYNNQIHENLHLQISNPTFEINQVANSEYQFPENIPYIQYQAMEEQFRNMQISQNTNNGLLQIINIQNFQPNINPDSGETYNNCNHF